MREHVPSHTALTTSLIRAHHTRLEPRPLLRDPWGDVLVPDQFRETLFERATRDLGSGQRVAAPESNATVVDRYLSQIPSYGGVILRSRFAEDALEHAISAGIKQYVLIGAGFDSFPLRRPSYAHGVSVYEVDHPATQQFKLQRISECRIPTPTSTYFISADLAREDLATTLGRTTFRLDEPAFFSWLGVTIYLTREANTASLRAIASCSAPGSEVVFTYSDEKTLDASTQSPAFRRMQMNAASMGEPFLSGYRPEQMAAYLASIGFALHEDLDGEQLSNRYSRLTASPLISSHFSRIALARVAAQPTV